MPDQDGASGPMEDGGRDEPGPQAGQGVSRVEKPMEK